MGPEPELWELLAVLDAAEGAGAPPHLVSWLRDLVEEDATGRAWGRRLMSGELLAVARTGRAREWPGPLPGWEGPP